MIALDSINKLKTSVVYVTDSSGREPDLGLLIGADPDVMRRFIDAPEASPSAAGGVVLTSMRNQFKVTIDANRLDFDDGSEQLPARSDFPERVATTAEHIVRQSDKICSAIGLNFHIEAASDDGELPSNAVLARLTRVDRLNSVGYKAIGVSARFWYEAGDSEKKRYDLRLEPRGSQYAGANYFASLNVHFALSGGVPSVDWLSDGLNAEYREFLRILMQLLDKKG